MKGDYDHASKLQELAMMMTRVLPELEDAKSAKWDVLYSMKELDHIGGKCKRVTGTEKFHTTLDYNILIHKPPFMDSGSLDRLRILAHELFHIFRDKGKFVIRNHQEDFCEIPAHDKFSYRLAHDAARELGIPV